MKCCGLPYRDDPLIPPAEAKPLPRVKEIKVTASADSDDEYELHTRLEPSPDSTADHLAAQDACPKIQ